MEADMSDVNDKIIKFHLHANEAHLSLEDKGWDHLDFFPPAPLGGIWGLIVGATSLTIKHSHADAEEYTRIKIKYYKTGKETDKEWHEIVDPVAQIQAADVFFERDANNQPKSKWIMNTSNMSAGRG